MKRLKAFKYRIYPNKSQQIQLAKTFGCVRYFQNHLINIFNSESEEKREYPTSTNFRKNEDWLREVSAAALQQKEIDFKEFKKQFFNEKRKTKVGRPKFKKKTGKQSYRLPNQKFKLFKQESRIKLEKISKIKIIQDRFIPDDARILSITISLEPSGEYYASILTEIEMQAFSKTQKEVGIDVGIKTFSTQSDGIEICNPKFFSKNQAKLKKLQQHFSRKKKGSNRREKCRLKIAKLHRKISNQRDHFLHNYSLFLIKNYDLMVIEDLNVKGLIEKKKLSKYISDVSWSKFFQMLQYKSDWYGKEIRKIDRYYASSKTCGCGQINQDLKLSDRKWTCSSCGTVNDRDLLAAQNILKKGTEI